MTSNNAAPSRLAIFSDIHGNFHALTAVLDSIAALGIADMVCLGDVVGYGGMPNECIDVLRERAIPTLAGNHDHAAVGMTDVTFFNPIAKRAVKWTEEVLTEDNSAWLRERPYTHEIPPSYFFVHASPREPEAWNYVLTFGEARACFELFAHPLCFIGHSHQPAVVEKNDDDLTCPEGYDIPLQEDRRYLVNVGSVGQPRDRNPAACYAYVDLKEKMLHYVRVDYEVQAAQEAILGHDLPEELAERLAHGW